MNKPKRFEPHTASELQPLIISELARFCEQNFGIYRNEVLTFHHVEKALTHFGLPNEANATNTAFNLLRRICPPIPSCKTSDAISFNRFVAGMLRASPLPGGKALISHLLQQAQNRHLALHHEYLRRLSGERNCKLLPNPRAALYDLARNYSVYNRCFRHCLKQALNNLQSTDHVDMLQQDIEEENGVLCEQTIAMLEAHGVKGDWVQGIPHDELFQRFVDAIERIDPSLQATVTDISPGEQLCASFNSLLSANATEACIIGALSVGTEAVVKDIYEKILEGIRKWFPEMKASEYVFFPLHTVVDQKHGGTLLRIAEDIVYRYSNVSEAEFSFGALSMLEAREKLWDALLERATHMGNSSSLQLSNEIPNERHGIERTSESLETSEPYNKQASAWIRRTPTCFSDFTARGRVVNLLRPTAGKYILDVGCGEGYLARSLRSVHGASAVVGVDISRKMIEAAKLEESMNPIGRLTYLVGDARTLVDVIKGAGPAEIPNYLRASDVNELFDSAVACFVFNYMTVEQMECVFRNVFTLLKPGGKFVFAVPHPSFKFWKTKTKGDELPFHWEDTELDYFDGVDCVSEGTIKTIDGAPLKVRNFHKTIQVYFETLKKTGFTEFPQLVELGVTADHEKMNEAFFKPLRGIPLHMAFSTEKPLHASFMNRSQEILWPSWTRSRFEQDNIFLEPPRRCCEETYKAACELVDKGFEPDTVGPRDVARFRLEILQEFADKIMFQLCDPCGVGATIITDLFQDVGPRFGDERVMKMMYLLLASLMGEVSKERKALWDVKDRNLNTSDDNVLFSATCEEAPYHTDGSRRDYFPDVVGLLCIRPAPDGGELRVTNACNVYHALKARLPPHIMAELERKNLVRDLIECGLGRNASDLSTCHTLDDVEDGFRALAMRNEAILKLRLEANTLPIFDREHRSGRVRFRYMRSWIESGHSRAGLQMKAQLVEALDALDRQLGESTSITRKLRRGEIVFSNNHIMAHARTAFTSGCDRLMVRVWVNSNARFSRADGASEA